MLPTYKFIAEYAKSSRSMCKGSCYDKKISKGSLRLGEMVQVSYLNDFDLLFQSEW